MSTGFDVERPVIDAARERRASDAVSSDRAAFVQAPPGPLPFADAAFDVVFSKDALLHVPDKDALFRRDLSRAEAGRRLCRQQLDDLAMTASRRPT